MCVFTRCQLYLNKTVLTITKQSKKKIQMSQMDSEGMSTLS